MFVNKSRTNSCIQKMDVLIDKAEEKFVVLLCYFGDVYDLLDPP